MKPEIFSLQQTAQDVSLTLTNRLRELGIRCKLSDDPTPMRIGCVDRDLGVYDRQVVIDPSERDWLDKAIAFISQAGTDLTFAPLELPCAIGSAYRVTGDGLTLRAIRAYDITHDDFVTRIDGLFKVNAAV